MIYKFLSLRYIGTNCVQRLSSNQLFKTSLAWSHDKRFNQSSIQSQIISNTEITRHHLTPEIALHLVTPKCDLWHSKGDDSPFPDPFWAFYWPGGQAVTRYVLDHKERVQGRHVLDLGCGGGATSIAAVIGGASDVVANDIDPVAVEAVKLNAKLNGVTVDISTENLLTLNCEHWDVVILGDMFYDENFASLINHWINHHVRKDTAVLIGYPGRLSFKNHPMKSMLTKLVKYELPEHCRLENNGLTTACVWELTQ